MLDSAVPDSLELRAEALTKMLPDDSVICRQTAAWLYGVDVTAVSDRSESPRLEFVRPTESRAVRATETNGHSQTHPIAGGRRLALEYDSDLWHSDPRSVRRDEQRVAMIEAGGWVLLSVGRGQVWGTDPTLEYAVGDLLEVRPKLPRRW